MGMESVSLTYLLHPPAYGLCVSLLQLSGPSSLTGPEFGIWHISDTIYPCQPRGEISQRSNRHCNWTSAPPKSLCAKTVIQKKACVEAFPSNQIPGFARMENIYTNVVILFRLVFYYFPLRRDEAMLMI